MISCYNQYGDIMQRYFALKKEDEKLFLKQDDFYHIYTVMRKEKNDEIEVVYDKKLYICALQEKEDPFVFIVKEIKEDALILPEIILVIPLLKEQKMDFILQKATELGVDQIIPVTTERTLVKLDEQRESKRILRWQKICKEASEQSKRRTIPTVMNLQKLTDLKAYDGLKILCSTTEKEKTLKKLLQTPSIYDKMIIVVGPEGGLSLQEEKYLNEIGFTSVTLGSRILRVETVPLYILSIMQYVFME